MTSARAAIDVFALIASVERCFVIAEIGSNHNGDFDLARRLMDVAMEAGADGVKFQSFLADQLVTHDSPDYELLKRIELPREWYPRLKSEAESRGLVFFSTATNDHTLGWMEEIDVALYKIASPNITHLPLIRNTASLGKPVIMSTGMATMREIDEAVQTFTATGNRKLCLLHCVSEYPALPASINLRFISTLQRMYSFPAGFSDHTLNIGVAIGAVALGARAIEKHLTLDRTMSGPDHHYAVESAEFITMTRNIRIVEAALGVPEKIVSSVERDMSAAYRRSLHATTNLAAGTVLTSEHVAVVRPNDGLHPRHLDEVIGLRLRLSVTTGEPLTWRLFGE